TCALPILETQPNLFEISSTQPSMGLANGVLVVRKGTLSRLSKAQQSFNRFARRIEKLRAELGAAKKRFDQDLKFLATEIHPLDEEISKRRSEIVILLFQFLKHTAIGKGARRTLRACLREQLDMLIRFFGELAPALR